MDIFEAVMSAGGEAVELRFYGQIGSSPFEEGITAKQVGEALAKAPNASQINVKLSSPGGSVFDGMAIRSMLAAHAAHVEVDIEGLAASAASVIAMGGDHVRMHKGASMMLHEGRVHTPVGDIASHKKAIAALEAINDGAASVYAHRSGKSKDDVLKLMAAETWLTPEQAMDLGFVDEVVAGKTAAPRMHFDLEKYGYQHVPPQLVAAMKELPMSYEQIAMQLGLSPQADAGTVTATVATLQRSLASRETMLAELRVLTGKQAEPEIIAVVRGLSDASAQLSTLTAELHKRDELLEAQAHAAVIENDKRDPKGRKLTPAMEPWAKTQTASALKAYLEVAPHQLQMAKPAGGKPAGDAQPPVTEGTATATPQLTFEGKTWEKLTPMEKHNLHFDDRATYDALYSEHIARKRAA